MSDWALADLAFLGDRRTAAAILPDGAILWYSPHRFDAESLFLGLLDGRKGGWRVALPDGGPDGRRYLEDSAVLETRLAAGGGALTVTDWLNMGRAARAGLLCRSLSRAPVDTPVSFEAWSGYGGQPAVPALVDGVAVFEDGAHLFASHPLRLVGHTVCWTLPAGEDGWTVLADGPCDRPSAQDVAAWQAATLAAWRDLAAMTTYRGPYGTAVAQSLRVLRLLVYAATGAVVAAPVAGLPEVTGGKRNYDYRYAWLRDTAMVVRAILRTAGRSPESAAFMRFVALSRAHASRPPLDAAMTVDGRPVPREVEPPLAGYAESRPVRIGNRAGGQLQLGALGSFLLAAAAIYDDADIQEHWDVAETVADFLADHWHVPDSGIWESPERRHYTTSKVFAACGLQAIVRYAGPARRRRYEDAVAAIRDYVHRHCLTREGAYAAFAGCEAVDISAALYPVWSFCPADTPEMQATIRVLQRDYEHDGLFEREDWTPEADQEGAFLAGSFWVAHYWIMRGDGVRARRYIEAGLAQANDVGIMPEEVDWHHGRSLGNPALGMSHASFLTAAADLALLEGIRPED